AGLKPGDQITSLAGTKIETTEAANVRLQTLEPGQKVPLEVRRGDQTLLVNAELGRLPENIPAELPAAHGDLPAAEGERPPVGLVKFKLPEFENECLAYVPENYQPARAYGVIEWLHGSGGLKAEEFEAAWKPLCEKYDFIVVAPRAVQ